MKILKALQVLDLQDTEFKGKHNNEAQSNLPFRIELCLENQCWRLVPNGTQCNNAQQLGLKI